MKRNDSRGTDNPAEGDRGDCAEAIDRLYHFIDGELTEERREQIRKHLDDCPPCLGAYDFEKELRQVIASKCRDHVPDALKERVRAALWEEAAFGDEATTL